MMMNTKLLIYDGKCFYCRSFVQLVHLLDRRKTIFVLPFDAPDSRALLHAQFGDHYGFAMYLFEHEQVSWGQEAAQRIIKTLLLPQWMARLAFHMYPSLVKLVSWLTRRERQFCGPNYACLHNSSQKQQLEGLQEGALQELERLLLPCAPQPYSTGRDHFLAGGAS